MRNFLKILILPIAIITMMGGYADVAFAQTPLDVQFSPNPLFDKPNFLPLDETSGVVTVTNNSGETQNILTEAINILDDDNFGSLLHLIIEGNSGTLFDDSLADFFSTAGEISLGAISNGESKTFTYTISFINSSDNSYQGKTLGFDVCVGFEGGNNHCGDTIVGEEGGGDEGGGGGTGGTGGGIPGSGGGGGGNGPVTTSLVIFNEQAINISNVGESGSATLTWDTNLLSTSQVIYGLASGGPYTLVLTPPNFGYPFATGEDMTKVIHHSVPIIGLVPGETYVYRVISRASPPTISYEHTFTVPLLAQASASDFTPSVSSETENEGGSVLGSPSNGSGSTGSSAPDATEEVALTEEEPNGLGNNLASVFASGFGNILSVCTLIALLILLAIYIIWRLWLRKKYEKDLVGEEEIKNRFLLFFGGALTLVILALLIFGNSCPLPILITAWVISLCLYAYRKLRGK